MMVQRRWRGNKARRGTLNLGKKLNLGYELRVLEQRNDRRRLIVGFMQHITYMGLLIAVFMLQYGGTVPARYALVAALKTHVTNLETPSGLTFDTISTVPEGAPAQMLSFTDTLAQA